MPNQLANARLALLAERLNQIPVIFSEDFQDGQVLEGVRFANPFAKSFDVEAWL
jgi:predicted nucleic acid-binding protein